MIYRAIGKAVVKYGVMYVRRRYGRQLRVLAGIGLASILVGGYLASRSVEEG
jgi:hypothetical protein